MRRIMIALALVAFSCLSVLPSYAVVAGEDHPRHMVDGEVVGEGEPPVMTAPTEAAPKETAPAPQPKKPHPGDVMIIKKGTSDK